MWQPLASFPIRNNLEFHSCLNIISHSNYFLYSLLNNNVTSKFSLCQMNRLFIWLENNALPFFHLLLPSWQNGLNNKQNFFFHFHLFDHLDMPMPTWGMLWGLSLSHRSGAQTHDCSRSGWSSWRSWCQRHSALLEQRQAIVCSLLQVKLYSIDINLVCTFYNQPKLHDCFFRCYS